MPAPVAVGLLSCLVLPEALVSVVAGPVWVEPDAETVPVALGAGPALVDSGAEELEQALRKAAPQIPTKAMYVRFVAGEKRDAVMLFTVMCDLYFVGIPEGIIHNL